MMHPLWVLVLSLVPGLLWVYYFYRQDPAREPIKLVLRAFFFGMLGVFPAGLLEAPFQGLFSGPSDLFSLFIFTFFIVGVVEESLKFAAAALAVRHRQEFDQVIDGVVYLVTAALGFAAVENYYYARAYGLAIAPARAIIASLAHASFSGVLGYYWGLGRFTGVHLRSKVGSSPYFSTAFMIFSSSVASSAPGEPLWALPSCSCYSAVKCSVRWIWPVMISSSRTGVLVSRGVNLQWGIRNSIINLGF